MSDFLALEWDHEQICGVQAQVSSGRVKIRRSFVLTKPAGNAAGESGALPVGWLRTELAQLGISGGQVLVTLPRSEAVVKRLELPETPDDDLPLLVRYQAAAKSSVALDELSLDFIPLPRRGELPGREVLMATVPRQTLDEIEFACRTAGLELASVGLTPAAVAELVARAEQGAAVDVAGESLVIARHGRRVEISVLSRQHLLFTHSARLSDDTSGQEPQAIVAEVSRALVSLRGAVSNVKIQRAWTLVGPDEHPQIAEAIGRRLDCTPQILDPFGGMEVSREVAAGQTETSLYAGPVGLLLARSDPRVPGIDFLAPRQPVARPDLRKRRAILAGAGAALLAATLGGLYALNLYDLQSRIDELSHQDAQLKALLKKGEPILQSAGLVEQWHAGETPWLDELATLSERMPPNDRAYLSSLNFDPKSGSAPARLRMEGFARDRDDIMKLGDRFHGADKKYRVLPHGTSAATTDTLYPWRFVSEILLTETGKALP